MWIVLLNHLDYVDCRMMNVMKLVEENLMVVVDSVDHLLDHHHRVIRGANVHVVGLPPGDLLVAWNCHADASAVLS